MGLFVHDMVDSESFVGLVEIYMVYEAWSVHSEEETCGFDTMLDRVEKRLRPKELTN